MEELLARIGHNELPFAHTELDYLLCLVVVLPLNRILFRLQLFRIKITQL